MAVFKCKMCGGDLNVTGADKVVTCEYCGTAQTVPSADDEKKTALFNRANRLRMNNEFDTAAALYEQLVAEFPEEAEAYWGLCLCNYGIEYVTDPASGEKKPTCHRASFQSLAGDDNFKLAMEYADVAARRVYRREAQEIDRINEEILALSRNEKPYDVFICYKETDEKGERTPDSVLAQDIYDALTAKGCKVFFSRITLEDKLGMQYEPYIFAALNSAKVMLSVGTKYEYFHAVWVKNEWSRFLRLAAKDKSKILIPCYKNMDPYDMPDEFKGLQAQDLGKLGAMQDLTRGVEKLLGRGAQPTAAAPVQTAPAGVDTVALLKRAELFLSDGHWDDAYAYCEKVLDAAPENAEAYLFKLMAELHVPQEEALAKCVGTLAKNENFRKILMFSDGALKGRVEEYERSCRYNYAVETLRQNKATEAKAMFEGMRGYRDTAQKITECNELAERQKAERARQMEAFETAAREAETERKSTEKKIRVLKIIKNSIILAGFATWIVGIVCGLKFGDADLHDNTLIVFFLSAVVFAVLTIAVSKQKSKIMQTAKNTAGMEQNAEYNAAVDYPAVPAYPIAGRTPRSAQRAPAVNAPQRPQNKTRMVVHYTGPFSVAPVVRIVYNNVTVGTIVKNATKEFYLDTNVNHQVTFTANGRSAQLLLSGDTAAELKWDSMRGQLLLQTSPLPITVDGGR